VLPTLSANKKKTKNFCVFSHDGFTFVERQFSRQTLSKPPICQQYFQIRYLYELEQPKTNKNSLMVDHNLNQRSAITSSKEYVLTGDALMRSFLI
jgi:hypothetical protein